MIKYLIILSAVVVLVVIFIIVISNCKYKFKLLNIKIDEATSNINLFLQKKKGYLDSIVKELINKKKDEGRFDEFLETINREKDSFRLHSKLSKTYSEVSKILFDNDKLAKDDSIIKYLGDLKENDEDLIGAIKFYNDTIVDYNGIIKSFPYSIIAKTYKYDEKEFYNNEKEELFEILKK